MKATILTIILLTVSYLSASMVNTPVETFLDVWYIIMSIMSAFAIITNT